MHSFNHAVAIIESTVSYLSMVQLDSSEIVIVPIITVSCPGTRQSSPT